MDKEENLGGCGDNGGDSCGRRGNSEITVEYRNMWEWREPIK